MAAPTGSARRGYAGQEAVLRPRAVDSGTFLAEWRVAVKPRDPSRAD
jgi:hypothetical protein